MIMSALLTLLLINNDIKIKKQQIEQLTQQVEQVINEKISFENERAELQRQVGLFRLF